MNLTSSQITKLGLALGLCYAAYKFSSNGTVKTAAVAVGAVIVAKQLPFVGDALN